MLADGVMKGEATPAVFFFTKCTLEVTCWYCSTVDLRKRHPLWSSEARICAVARSVKSNRLGQLSLADRSLLPVQGCATGRLARRRRLRRRVFRMRDLPREE